MVAVGIFFITTEKNIMLTKVKNIILIIRRVGCNNSKSGFVF